MIENPITELQNTFDDQIIKNLLIDHATGGNIIWATDDYTFKKTDPIRAEDVKLIKPRFAKEKERRRSRTKARAEVFTPPAVCKIQNDLIVEPWKDKPDELLGATFLEIACGEAPYIVGRYNVVDGNPININDRIGLLDRKMKIVNQKDADQSYWCQLTRRAFQSVYGYEFQGDNLLIARANLLLTAAEYRRAKFNDNLPPYFIEQLADIISWNFFQFDGINNTLPFHEGGIFNPCQIVDWAHDTVVDFPF